ncbi:hypothetical protein PS3A_09390 [Pseudomonas sp. 3A(2025)]
MPHVIRQLALSLCPLLLCGHAVQASANTCPEVSSIVQQASADGGFTYSAPAGNSFKWVGEKTYEDKQALDKLKFESALATPDKSGTLCKYKEGQNSLLLELKREAPFCAGGIDTCLFSVS